MNLEKLLLLLIAITSFSTFAQPAAEKSIDTRYVCEVSSCEPWFGKGLSPLYCLGKDAFLKVGTKILINVDRDGDNVQGDATISYKINESELDTTSLIYTKTSDPLVLNLRTKSRLNDIDFVLQIDLEPGSLSSGLVILPGEHSFQSAKLEMLCLL